MRFSSVRFMAMGLVLCLALLSSCKKSAAPAALPEASQLVFTNNKGDTISQEELSQATGTYNFELYGTEGVSKKARDLMTTGRKQGMTGDYANALKTLEEAHTEAPAWPYPPYEMAYTYLLQDDYPNALKYYQLTDQLAPRGFYTCKTALHTLKREEKGTFPRGLYKSYLSFESIQGKGQKKKLFKTMTRQYPNFALGWQEYSVYLEGKEKLDAIETGLGLQPDAETKGVLLINKAMALDLSGDSQKASILLVDLIFDPNTTLSNVEFAKFVLNTIETEQP